MNCNGAHILEENGVEHAGLVRADRSMLSKRHSAHVIYHGSLHTQYLNKKSLL